MRRLRKQENDNSDKILWANTSSSHYIGAKDVYRHTSLLTSRFRREKFHRTCLIKEVMSVIYHFHRLVRYQMCGPNISGRICDLLSCQLKKPHSLLNLR
jgi:hypothetical protein